MKFRVDVSIMPHKALLDPQGKAVCHNMPNVGITGVSEVRIGKHIQMILEATDEEDARQKADESCRKILVNPITESYEFSIYPI
jgi:phosphoribosylformylglycinamidine synthase PurS subunit